MGATATNWTPIGSRHPAKIEAGPLLQLRQRERDFAYAAAAEQCELTCEPAGPLVTALVLGTSAIGSSLHFTALYFITRAVMASIGGA